VAERIRQNFAYVADEVAGLSVRATVSIGLVHCLERTLEIPDLLAQADHALYYAKERGRNRVEVASLAMMAERRERGLPSTISATAFAAKGAA
jgi:diguanylate cyclase (GGDEF)-like protein